MSDGQAPLFSTSGMSTPRVHSEIVGAGYDRKMTSESNVCVIQDPARKSACGAGYPIKAAEPEKRILPKIYAVFGS
jgi:hypothetical protein